MKNFHLDNVGLSNIKETGNAHRDPAAGAQEGYLYRYLLHPETIGFYRNDTAATSYVSD